jgi:PIN domain nuclease of toxin-antitoxin system
MKFLLDTHVLLWWWGEPDKLSRRVLALLRDPSNQVFVSAASAWEISTKYRIGKLPSGGTVIAQWGERLAMDRFMELPISAAHSLRAGGLPGEHRDPFDRMLSAQSLMEKLPVATADPEIAALGAERLWD